MIENRQQKRDNELFNYMCAGFIYLKSNSITKQMLEYWNNRMLGTIPSKADDRSMKIKNTNTKYDY